MPPSMIKGNPKIAPMPVSARATPATVTLIPTRMSWMGCPLHNHSKVEGPVQKEFKVPGCHR